MRHIPTSVEQVERLKKQAKRLQRNGGGKHADLLDKVARGAGYDHWHHVTRCLSTPERTDDLQDLWRDIAEFQQMAIRGESAIRIVGGDWLDGSLVLMAWEGDAWLFEPQTHEVMCLAFNGQLDAPEIRDLGAHIEMGFDGEFHLDRGSIQLSTDHPAVGNRTIIGCPIDELRLAIELAGESANDRFDSVFVQQDAVALSPDLIEKLVQNGWNRQTLEDSKREGAKYSPSRGTILTKPTYGNG